MPYPRRKWSNNLAWAVWLQRKKNKERRGGGGDDKCRFYYVLNGSNNVIETNARLLPDPSSGNFFVEFSILREPVESGTFVAQNISSSAESREFQIYTFGEDFRIIWCGETYITNTEISKGKFRFEFGTNEIALIRNGELVETLSAIPGSAKEPTATFTIGARHNNALNTYGFYFGSIIFNVNVNGTNFYSIDDNQSLIRDKIGSNNAELLNMVQSNWERICNDPSKQNAWIDGEPWNDPDKWYD